MYFRQIAVATALFAMLALAGVTANPLDVGIGDGRKESGPVYSFEPDVVTLMEEGIVP